MGLLCTMRRQVVRAGSRQRGVAGREASAAMRGGEGASGNEMGWCGVGSSAQGVRERKHTENFATPRFSVRQRQTAEGRKRNRDLGKGGDRKSERQRLHVSDR